MDVTYKEVFSSSYPKEMEPIAKLLTAQGIVFKVDAGSLDFNPNFAFSRPPDSIRLMVAENDYAAARNILVQHRLVSDISEEDGFREMLGELENDELMEILIDAHAYPPEQVAMARKLLEERGTAPPEPQLAEARAHTAAKQEVPDELSTRARVIGTLISVLIPPAGFAFGIAIFLLKKRDVLGKSHPLYGKSSKSMAIVFIAISSVILLIYIVMSFLRFQLMDRLYW